MAEKPTENELENGIRDLKKIYDVTTTTNTSSSLENTLKPIAAHITEILNVSGCAILLWRRDKNQLETLIDYYKIYPDVVDELGYIYDLGKYPETLNALETNQIYHIRIDDPEANALELMIMKEQEVFESLILPLTENNQVLGLLEIYNDAKFKKFTKQELQLAISLTSQATIAVKNAQLYQSAQSEIIKRKKIERLLKENEVELIQKSKYLEQANLALKSMLDHRNTEKRAIEANIFINIKKYILPYVEDIEKKKPGGEILVLINILKTTINQLMSPASQALFSKYIDFTPMEVKVADLVKQGMQSKEIGQCLNIAKSSVSTYRNNIRKKLNLDNTKINLRVYLNSLES